MSELDALVAEMITQNPLIFDRALDEQFDKLIYQPFQQMSSNINDSRTFIAIVKCLERVRERMRRKSNRRSMISINSTN